MLRRRRRGTSYERSTTHRHRIRPGRVDTYGDCPAGTRATVASLARPGNRDSRAERGAGRGAVEDRSVAGEESDNGDDVADGEGGGGTDDDVVMVGRCCCFGFGSCFYLGSCSCFGFGSCCGCAAFGCVQDPASGCARTFRVLGWLFGWGFSLAGGCLPRSLLARDCATGVHQTSSYVVKRVVYPSYPGFRELPETKSAKLFTLPFESLFLNIGHLSGSKSGCNEQLPVLQNQWKDFGIEKFDCKLGIEGNVIHAEKDELGGCVGYIVIATCHKNPVTHHIDVDRVREQNTIIYGLGTSKLMPNGYLQLNNVKFLQIRSVPLQQKGAWGSDAFAYLPRIRLIDILPGKGSCGTRGKGNLVKVFC